MSPLISGLASVASLIFNAASARTRPNGAEQRPTGPDDALPSARFTLSREAEGMAGAAGKVARASAMAADHGMRVSNSASVSVESFQQVLSRFGADDARGAALAAEFDGNRDGIITRDEFMRGMSRTAGAGAQSPFSQSVLEVMDRAGNADGVVSAREFAELAQAFGLASRQSRSA